MTGPEHYEEAERLLADSDEVIDYDIADQMIRRAGVHAQLALAAATALGLSEGERDAGMPSADSAVWYKLVSVTS
jgi:hypothetical protein